MNNKTLKKVLDGKKIQDSTNCEKLTETLKSIGFKVDASEPVSFCLIDGDTVIAVSAVVFKNLSNDEISADDLYTTYEESKITYEEGQLLTADRGDDHYTFVYLKDHTDGTLLGLGMCANGLSRDIMRYTKRRCRKATDAEKEAFVEVCKQHGICIEFLDGKIDVFKLRGYGQKYYSVFVNFKSKGVDVEEFTEEHDFTDNYNFESGNYFRSEEEALKAFKSFK